MRKIIKIVVIFLIGLLVALYKDHILEIAKGSRPHRPEGLVVPTIESIMADVQKALNNPKWTLPDETNATAVLTEHVQFLVKYGYVDELEELAETVRDPKHQFPSGYTYRDTFYRAAKYLPITSEEAYINPYRYWAKKKKKSVAAHVALSDAYLNLAWNTRYDGDVTVSADGKPKTFGERMLQAKLALEKAEEFDDDEPHLYVTRMWINLGLGKRGSIGNDFERAVKANPHCYPAYLARAVSLVPGNGGELEQWTDFARSAGPRHLPATGKALFAYLVTAVNLHFASNETGFESDRFHNGVLDWDEVNVSFQDFTNARPESAYVLNRYARMAFEAGQPEVVAHVVERLGEQLEKSVIRNQWLYSAYKDFAKLPRNMVSTKPVQVIYTEPYESVNDVTFSGDGRIMAISDMGGNVTVWNMETIRQIRHLKPPLSMPATSVAFSRDQKYLAATFGHFGLADKRGKVAFWDTKKWKLKRLLSTSEMPSSITFTDDGKLALVTTFHDAHINPSALTTINLADFTTSQRNWNIRLQFRRPMLLSQPKNTLLAVAGHTLMLVNSRTNQPLAACVGTNRAQVECHSTIWDYEFSPNKNLLAVGRGPIYRDQWESGRLEIYDSKTFLPVKMVPDETIAGMQAIAWGPDGKYLFAGGHDETVTMWDPFTWEKKAILLGHGGTISALTVCPDRRHLASASHDGSVRIWDISELN